MVISNDRWKIATNVVHPEFYNVKCCHVEHWFVWEAFLCWEDLEALESLIQAMRQEQSNNMSSYPDLSLGGNSDSLGQIVEESAQTY